MTTNMPPKAPRSAMAVMAALLLSALAVGVALDRVYLVRSGRLIPDGIPSTPPLTRPSIEQQNEIFEALRRELVLRDEQMPAVRRIIIAQMNDLERIRTSVRPQLDSIFEITRDSLDVVLDATQRSKRDALLLRMAPVTDSLGLRRR